jgi:hypothetical protein
VLPSKTSIIPPNPPFFDQHQSLHVPQNQSGGENATASFSLLMSFSRGDVEGGEVEGVLEIWGIEHFPRSRVQEDGGSIIVQKF